MTNLREQNPANTSPSQQVGKDHPAPARADTPASADAAAEQLDRWIREAQAGDRRAMEQLLEHFQDRVWRRARYRLRDHDEAWDVAQDVFIQCFRKIGQFRHEAPFWSWLARIVDNQVKNRQNWWRRRGKGRTFSMEDLGPGDPDDPTPWDPPDSTPGPDQQAAGREAADALQQALGRLAPDHREILLLRFSDHLAYEEIAETLQLSIGTVKSRIHRARAELREHMGDWLKEL